MPSAVSPDYFVAKKGAGQAKGRQFGLMVEG